MFENRVFRRIKRTANAGETCPDARVSVLIFVAVFVVFFLFFRLTFWLQFLFSLLPSRLAGRRTGSDAAAAAARFATAAKVESERNSLDADWRTDKIKRNRPISKTFQGNAPSVEGLFRVLRVSCSSVTRFCESDGAVYLDVRFQSNGFRQFRFHLKKKHSIALL